MSDRDPTAPANPSGKTAGAARLRGPALLVAAAACAALTACADSNGTTNIPDTSGNASPTVPGSASAQATPLPSVGTNCPTSVATATTTGSTVSVRVHLTGPDAITVRASGPTNNVIGTAKGRIADGASATTITVDVHGTAGSITITVSGSYAGTCTVAQS